MEKLFHSRRKPKSEQSFQKQYNYKSFTKQWKQSNYFLRLHFLFSKKIERKIRLKFVLLDNFLSEKAFLIIFSSLNLFKQSSFCLQEMSTETKKSLKLSHRIEFSFVKLVKMVTLKILKKFFILALGREKSDKDGLV